MRLWKKATGTMKDKNSIWAAKFSGHGPCRNPNLETLIIKATSHDDSHIDCQSVQRVFQWLRTSPMYLKPLVFSLSMRMQKTKSWVVALKGLMLIHGIFCCDIPAVQNMGRLPFDFSNFYDAHLDPAKAWSFNSFVRSYFNYLDQKSAFLCSEVARHNQKMNKDKQKKKVEDDDVVELTLMEELEDLQKLQAMLDMLMQIKPRNNSNVGNMSNLVLILEAMDCVIVEVFDVYSKFCKKIARVLLRIYDVGGKVEAGIGLKVLQKASTQGDHLSQYFEYCRDIGVLNASQCPIVERIPEEEIRDLERIIHGASSEKKSCLVEGSTNEDIGNKAIVLRDCSATATISKQKETENGCLSLTTVITHQWVVFDDENDVSNDSRAIVTTTTSTNPFEESYSLVPYHHPVQNQAPFPDLISF